MLATLLLRFLAIPESTLWGPKKTFSLIFLPKTPLSKKLITRLLLWSKEMFCQMIIQKDDIQQLPQKGKNIGNLVIVGSIRRALVWTK